jgi:hypothetical protein
MKGVLLAPFAVLLVFNLPLHGLFVLADIIILPIAFGALQGY